MNPLHERDVEYLTEFPSPIIRMHQENLHFTHINGTTCFFAPMMYFLLRQMRARKVLEIGVAEGYSSLYLAHAVKDNAVRFQYTDAKYYGIDINGGKLAGVKKHLNDRGLDATFKEMDSININADTFGGEIFDVIFQDGAHDTEHVLKEIEVLYPFLRGDGHGYLLFHDCYGPAEEGFMALQQMIKDGKYKFEYVRLDDDGYSLAILRKMDDVIEKRRWA